MNAKVIRISTGEEVVFDLIEETDETYVVENALFAVPQASVVKWDLHLGHL